ncbi:hypothetical protein Y032_0135g1935 [Ancylostoma ceylanicum]|uniref:Uncharacterized protein n=1 Tax=Ancylostoma ceylanicum TaxID=53326 RepID=A0A016T5T6_9BILA|nr:hypothetical protein Y032_0135g1935 [Ancylostoma ceylanicum]
MGDSFNANTSNMVLRPNVHDALFLVQFRIWKKVSGAILRSTTAKKVCSYCEEPISCRRHEPVKERLILVLQKQLR